MKIKRFAAVMLILAISVGIGYGAQKLEDYKIKKNHPLEYEAIVNKYANMYSIPKELLYAVIKCESSFKSDAVSAVGARGLMQLMPATFADVSKRMGAEYTEEMMFDPEINVRCGAYYLNYLYDIFKDWNLVLAAYNGGMGNVRKWMADSEYFDGAKIIKYPKGFDETERYVEKVNNAKNVYKELYFSNEEEEL